MAEANYHGKTSKAFWKPSGGDFAPIDNLVGWSMTGVVATAESTVMHATKTGKTREVGFKGATATVTCNVGGDNQIDEGAVGSLELLRDGTNASKGYASATDGAICTGASPGVDKDGIETVTYTFQFRKAISSTVTQGSA